MSTIKQALAEAARQLTAVHDSPRLDAEVLLSHVLGENRSFLFAWPERSLSPEEYRGFRALVERRGAGAPIAHLTGSREFWSLELEVTAQTLIPRPETELLVEQALDRIPRDAPWSIADLGTGSGAIALAIAGERPRCRVVTVDRSAAALAVARRNARRLGLDNVTFVEGSWLAPLAGERFQVIVSNPPYIRADDPHLGRGDLRFEPPGALVSGPDGLDDIRHIVSEARHHLAPGGWLLLEHGHNQGPAVGALFEGQGYRELSLYRDGAERDRVTAGRRIHAAQVLNPAASCPETSATHPAPGADDIEPDGRRDDMG